MRSRAVPPPEELRAMLAESGVEDAPTEGDPEELQGLLALALHVADCEKRVRFAPFSWADPAFEAADARTTLRFELARLHARDAAGLRDLLLASLPRVEAPGRLLALDARPSGLPEFAITHALYGEPSLFQFRHRPSESADPRIDAAREKGWAKTLKEHNLLPGRGLVVLDEHQGLFLREPWLDGLLGVLVLLADGNVHLMWNPFAARADPEIQHWLSWGRGEGAASEWRELVRHERE